MTRYALSRKTGDYFQVEFRPDCERTYFDRIKGNDESLLEAIERLNKHGYDLINSYEEFLNLLEKRKETK